MCLFTGKLCSVLWLLPRAEKFGSRERLAGVVLYNEKGQPLLAVYSKDLKVAQQAYVFALNQLERFKNGDEPAFAFRADIP